MAAAGEVTNNGPAVHLGMVDEILLGPFSLIAILLPFFLHRLMNMSVANSPK